MPNWARSNRKKLVTTTSFSHTLAQISYAARWLRFVVCFFGQSCTKRFPGATVTPSNPFLQGLHGHGMSKVERYLEVSKWSRNGGNKVQLRPSMMEKAFNIQCQLSSEAYAIASSCRAVATSSLACPTLASRWWVWSSIILGKSSSQSSKMQFLSPGSWAHKVYRERNPTLCVVCFLLLFTTDLHVWSTRMQDYLSVAAVLRCHQEQNTQAAKCLHCWMQCYLISFLFYQILQPMDLSWFNFAHVPRFALGAQ